MADESYIEFREAECPPQMVTKRWRVVAKDGGVPLGDISWYPAWRRYVYWPVGCTLYEEDCLRRIAEFVEAKTREHKAARKQKESQS